MRAFRRKIWEILSNQEGFALFLVISAMTVLSLVASELAYVATVNQRMAMDGLDQVKALYLAKTGFKISLLRLKAYQTVKGLAGGKETPIKLPKNILDKIWSFPFIFPIPSAIPGLDPRDKDSIDQFQKDSALEGSFTAIIESESSRYNLNLILGGFGPKTSAGTDTSTSTGTGSGTTSGSSTGSKTDTATGTSTGTAFNVEDARNSLRDLIGQILDAKFQKDPDFAADYRDLRLEDLMDGIYAWADRSYERKANVGREPIKPKQAPFYTLSELRMVYPMDDQIYGLLAPNFTATTTPGVNVNTMKESVLRSLVPGVSDDEVKEFYKFRDDPKEDNSFKDAEAFFKYIQEKIAKVGGEKGAQTLKDDLKKRRIQIVTDENTFKITVQGQVNQAVRVIEAWVSLSDPSSENNGSGGGKDKSKDKSNNDKKKTNEPENPEAADPGTKTKNNSGLKVTFMRIL